MGHSKSVWNGRRSFALAFAGLSMALLTGCSSDATRFTDPFTTPFGPNKQMGSGARQADASYSTSSTQDTGYRAPVSHVASESLPPVQSAPIAPVRAQPRYSQTSYPSASYAQASPYAVAPHQSPTRQARNGGGLGAQSGYEMPTATTPMAPGTANAPHGIWTAAGGTPIVVAQGESAPLLAQRYGVPLDSLLQVNGFASSAQVQPGARMVIPVYSARAPGERAPILSQRATRVEPTRTVSQEMGRDSGRARYAFQKGADSQPVPTRTQQANKAKLAELAHEAKLAEAKALLAQEALAKANKQQAARAHATPTRVAAADPRPVVAPVRAQRVAMAVPEKPAPRVDQTPTASVAPDAQQTTAVAASEAAAPEFRWPARGRIIQGYYSGGNDGINIAVPEGTAVKAAESGVVAYAGNELKGYGNLILIRHPNGFVSAYANNGELIVKRGETVKRGQVIAKSGQTGNVASPQLHFELRKGQTPVDPTQYLAGL